MEREEDKQGGRAEKGKRKLEGELEGERRSWSGKVKSWSKTPQF